MKQNKQLIILLGVVAGIVLLTTVVMRPDTPSQTALPTAPLPAGGDVPPPDTSLWIERDPNSFIQNPQCTQAGGNLRCNPAMHTMLNGQAVTSPILHSGALTYHMDFTVRMAGTENVFANHDDESEVVGIAFENNNVSLVGFVNTPDYDYWGIRRGEGYVKLCTSEGGIQYTDWACPWSVITSE